MNWLFKDPPNVAVITTTKIVNMGFPILHVSHDEDDGMWQFHDGSELNVEDGRVVSLQEIVAIDPGLMELHDLPEGWIAWRNNTGEEWNKIKLE
ncbi:hypothetical protein [Paenibacillus sp. YIM B09110]|uniref:hypothetical protein n=1 Tax=Paenibacillus sp. YIM B09110 TaxID=3126102 RepID=UPI00301E1F99